ncbi:hypothetical protein A2982_02685 [candidate division WWE3 bacterium RIFCSPLOWO2_01_FULL_39_13]|uniref:Probable transcriptional regulatory protein A2982_02685 n=1 Tax=candidate division WWE3 bacterium RIFCSPLOWO2_01_FULL_39_13 TaxID=1802624 RepID=A0A1F4V2R9_UNCKA|nr:MAG: hypothetical protein A2982_02685 [candidate division WWE3 bacterium RIFCSPLOWO2_01_FULL_39_13]
MSGHSKWSTIKRKKGALDAQRGKVFSKLAREIIIATREGGDDISANPTLRTFVDKAREQNMPKENIERAIKRGAGKLEGVQIVESQYEGYGPGGVAFLINCLTDNKNRTVSEIRNIFTKNGGSLAEAGAVSYIFAKSPDRPVFRVPLEDKTKYHFESLLDQLEELDDIVVIYHNAQI